MSMPTTHYEAMDDDEAWIEAEIQRQLDSLTPAQLNTEEDKQDYEDVTSIEETTVEPDEDFMSTYVSKFSTRFKIIEDEITECDNYLQQVDQLTSGSDTSRILEEFIVQRAQEENQDEETIRQQILEEIEKEKADSEDETEYIDVAERKEDNTEHTDDKTTLQPEEGMLVEFQESTFLEHVMKQELKNLEQKQLEREEQLKKSEEERKSKDEEIKRQREEVRLKRQLENDRIEQELAQERLAKQSKLAKEITEQTRLFEDSMKDMQKEIANLEERTKKEHEEFSQQREKEIQTKSKQESSAASSIQRYYKGFSVRKEYGSVLAEKKKQRLTKQHKERIQVVEQEREERNKQIMEKKQDEERKKALEEERKTEEKRKQAEEEESKRKAEEKRIQEEEAKRVEEEKRIEEEKKLAEQLKKDEESKKEEIKRLEEERIKEEKRMEEERKRKEEEIRKQKEAEEKKNQEKLAEKLRIEEEIKRQEHEARLLEEERIKQERLEKEKEEMRKKEEERKMEEQLRIEEENRQKEEQLKKEADREQETNEGMNRLMSDSLEQKRLAWIKECKPWSKIESELKSRKIVIAKKPPRRPTSAKQLPLLMEDVILHAGRANSLRQVTTVELHDLPGCNVSTLNQCHNLESITMNDCNLVFVDGLDNCINLKYAEFKNNKIEMINFQNQPDLVYLDVSHNALSSIHGLDSCTNLRHLDMSHNRITKIVGLSSCKNLHTLKLNSNQLISTRGLSTVPTIQVLHLASNHLPAIEDLDALGLLRVLDAHSNTIMQFPSLSNQVLLTDLDLNDNNISSMEDCSKNWLPLLSTINMAQNGLTDTDGLQYVILLRSLDLKFNQISDVECLLMGLTGHGDVQTMYIEGNPVTEDLDIRDNISKALSSLQCLDHITCISTSTSGKITSFKDVYSQQSETWHKLRTVYRNKLSQNSQNGTTVSEDLLKTHIQYFKGCHALSVDHRYANEYGNLSISSSDPQQKSGLSQVKPVGTGMEQSSQNANDKGVTNLENTAAVIIQSSWRGYCVRRDIDLGTERWMSAVKIQAYWRGYRLRKRLNYALNYANMDDLDDEFGDDVDLSSFEFQEADLERDWIPPNTPQIPANHAVIGGRPPSGRAVDNMPYNTPHPPSIPRQAWRNVDSPTLSDRSMTPHGRPPRPPSSQMSGDETHRSALSRKEEKLSEEWGFRDPHTAELMVQRAKKLKYNADRKKKLSKLDPRERLALFRRLEESTGVKTILPPNRNKPTNKVEYFQARQDQERRHSASKDVECKEKTIRTYEWLHSQVEPSSATDSGHTIIQGRSQYHGSESNLPEIGQDIINGGRVNLTGSPISVQSVTTMSSNNSLNRRRHSISESHTEKYAVELPPIKTNSAPSSRRTKENISDQNSKQSIISTTSWRNPVKNTEIGWGGGRKRNHRK